MPSSALSDAVNQANSALRKIADINRQLGLTNVQDATTATLQDQRDFYLDQLSQLMDIKVVQSDHNQVQVFTRAGTQLVGDRAASIIFDAKGSLSAASQWDVDPAKRSVGTLLLDPGAGTPVDMISGDMIGSGKIAALLEMRDHVLIGAQAQLDQIAAAMSSALSDRTTAGTAASFGVAVRVRPRHRIAARPATRSPHLHGHADQHTAHRHAGAGRRSARAAAVRQRHGRTDDKVIGIDFSGGLASALAQINSALGPAGLHVSNPSGTTLRVLDYGAGGKVALNALTATDDDDLAHQWRRRAAVLPRWHQALLGRDRRPGQPEPRALPAASRSNAALLADPSRLVVYADLAADLGCRCDAAELHSRSADQRRAATSRRGRHRHGAAPFSGSLQSYIRQMISQQGEAAANADSLQSGPAGRRQYAAAALCRQVERQHRRGNGQSDEAADRIRRRMRASCRRQRTCWTSCCRWCEAKMNVTGVGVTSSLVVQSLGDMRSTARRPAAPARHRQEVDDLCGPRHRPRARGRPARQARSHHGLRRIPSAQVGVRISVQQTALSQIADLGSTVKSATFSQKFDLDGSGQTVDAAIRDGAARSDPRQR